MAVSGSPRSDRNVTSDRGQTPQDFAMGIGIFIIAVAFAFAFIPTAFNFSNSDVTASETKLAERASMQLVSNFSVGERQNTINGTATADFFNETDTEEELRDVLNLPDTAQLNVSIRTLDQNRVVTMVASDESSVQLVAGDTYTKDRPSAEVVRVIQTSNDEPECIPACRLIVRVW